MGVRQTAIGNITSLWVKPRQLSATQHTQGQAHSLPVKEDSFQEVRIALGKEEQSASLEHFRLCPMHKHSKTLGPWLRHLSHQHHHYPSGNSKTPAAVHYTGNARTQLLTRVWVLCPENQGTYWEPNTSEVPLLLCNRTAELYYPSKKLTRHYSSLLEGKQLWQSVVLL